MPLPLLPIDDVLPQLIRALQQAQAVVLRAPTGAGKTTRVPPVLLDAGLAGAGKDQILVLQPRRVAARATAARMAAERSGKLGDEVGYQTRFDSRVSRVSRIVCVTEGILLRRLLGDPFLEGVACVVFDEFHERNLASDLALGMVRQLQQTVRPELKIVVMSATLDPAPIAKYLGECPTVESQGRTFPVTIEHTRTLERRFLAELAIEGLEQVLTRTSGDVLVFLPGVGEIKAAHKLASQKFANDNLRIVELYGDLTPEQQDATLAPSSQRKIILSTNIAETSLTIEGVTGVVDTGVARINRFDDASGLDRLELTTISQASAEHRAGRAGRTAPGFCLRLWPEASHRARPAMETPEIRRVDLAGAVLQLHSWIEPDPQQFPWFEPPRPAALQTAVRLLERLEATHNGQITNLGRQLAELPLHPRLARLVIAGAEFDIAPQAALAAALLSERDPFIPSGGGMGRSRRVATHGSASDLLDRVHDLEAFEAGESISVNVPGAKAILRIRDQILRQTERLSITRAAEPTSPDVALLRAVLAGYPDRVARRRELGSRRGVMVGGRGVRLADSSAVQDAEFFVCLDVDGSQSEALVRQASLVKRSWLPEELIDTRVEVFYDESRQQLSARRRVVFDDLLLEESPAAVPSGEAVTLALAAAAATHWDRSFPKDNAALSGFIERVNFLHRTMPELELPKFDEATLQSLLPQLCEGRRSFEELRRAPWLDYLRGKFSYQQLQTIEREAPERIDVPSGNRITLLYEPDRPPVLAVRLQELFGLPETPRVAGGRVRVLLHLLAPNMRPQQITDDLASFWNNTYQQVRKDLRARYPKHSWPEDPWNAPPQRRPTRKS